VSPASGGSALRVGSIYQDGETAGMATDPERWEMRDAAVSLLQEALDGVFDRDDERRIRALLEVLDWHKPWMQWEQVFAPYYAGTRFHGQGCRTCGLVGKRPCSTVLAVTAALGIAE